MNIQVMDALGIKRAFALGTSQGGFITVRMALIAPDRVCVLQPNLHLSCEAIKESSSQLSRS